MADTLNQWTGIGHLGRDPEVRTFGDGGKIANISLGCTDAWQKDGQEQKRTFWAKVVLKGNRANAADHLKKGDKLLVQGRLEERKWQDQSGNDRYSTEVVVDGFSGRIQFLTPKSDSGQQSTQTNTRTQQGNQQQAGGSWSGGYNSGPQDLDDEIPFSPCVD